MPKTIRLIYGRHYKPPKADLRRIWLDALRFGIARDHPKKLKALKVIAWARTEHSGDSSRRESSITMHVLSFFVECEGDNLLLKV